MNIAPKRVKLMLLLACAALAGHVVAAEKGKTAGRTQYYGAIAYHSASGSFGWASDRRTSRDARIEALEQCGRQECVIVATLSRSCGALAKNSQKFIVQKGATRKEAETKAMGKCGPQCEIAVWTCTR
jgi:outer membrane biogenesis lipoprotein LolB